MPDGERAIGRPEPGEELRELRESGGERGEGDHGEKEMPRVNIGTEEASPLTLTHLRHALPAARRSASPFMPPSARPSASHSMRRTQSRSRHAVSNQKTRLSAVSSGAVTAHWARSRTFRARISRNRLSLLPK